MIFMTDEILFDSFSQDTYKIYQEVDYYYDVDYAYITNPTEANLPSE